MKYIKTYENLLKGKSKEFVLNSLDGKKQTEIIRTLIRIGDFEHLPRNEDGVCIYDGDVLSVRECNLTSLPDNLTVNGHLDCCLNNLSKLPENLTVTNGIYCRGQKTGITLEIPESANIKGGIYN